tara:strand:- start:64 stop:180 length:117 start_codon:yes stop_codon:yes gene_type:complete
MDYRSLSIETTLPIDHPENDDELDIWIDEDEDTDYNGE